MKGSGNMMGTTSNAAGALAVFFERGFVSAPTVDKREGGELWLFANAEPLPAIAGVSKNGLICEQGFRPRYLALEKTGYNVSAELDPRTGPRCGAIFIVGRSRKANEADLARLWTMVRPGGSIVVAGDRNSGVEALEKWAGKLVEISGRFSKHHARVFWMVRSQAPQPFQVRDDVATEHLAGSGMFSADGPDAGSRLLASRFDGRVGGLVADFGAGWGYLGMELLTASDSVTRLDSLEADWRSLKAAESNLTRSGSRTELRFLWLDVINEPTGEKYDWIVTNPPFHVSRAAEPAIGNAFIEAAAGALRPGGRLLMVANRNLPYEATLARHFAPVRLLEEADGFKIIEGVRMAGAGPGRRR